MTLSSAEYQRLYRSNCVFSTLIYHRISTLRSVSCARERDIFRRPRDESDSLQQISSSLILRAREGRKTSEIESHWLSRRKEKKVRFIRDHDCCIVGYFFQVRGINRKILLSRINLKLGVLTSSMSSEIYSTSLVHRMFENI